MDDMPKYTIEEISLVQTCVGCPEEYDAFIGDEQVGYLRLRHGYFRVDSPDCHSETIYGAHTKGDGMFESDERDQYLLEAKQAIISHLNGTTWYSLEDIELVLDERIGISDQTKNEIIRQLLDERKELRREIERMLDETPHPYDRSMEREFKPMPGFTTTINTPTEMFGGFTGGLKYVLALLDKQD